MPLTWTANRRRGWYCALLYEDASLSLYLADSLDMEPLQLRCGKGEVFWVLCLHGSVQVDSDQYSKTLLQHRLVRIDGECKLTAESPKTKVLLVNHKVENG